MKDMTTGNPVKLVLGFAVPMLIGNVFQQFYNVVDTVVVGKYLGETQLAGVGSTGTLTGFLFALVYGMSNGSGIIVAQCYGSKKTGQLKKTVVSLIWVSAIMAVLLSVIGLIFSETFLRLLSVPDNVIGYSVTYLKIIYGFVYFSVICNGAGAILRAVGDSKAPLYALIVSSFVNVGLDLLFVIVFDMGVKGVAWATIIAQFVSAVITLYFLIRKRKEIGLTKLNLRPDLQNIHVLVKTGFPAAFQSCMISLGGMSVQRLINSFGSTVMAAYVAANRIDSVAIQVIVSIGSALSVFTGQNIGSGNYKRIREGLYKTMCIMVGASFLIAVLVLTFRYPLLRLFLDSSSSAEAIEYGAVYLTIIGIAYVIAGVMNSYLNVIRGAGDVNTCMIAGLTELSGRIVFAYILAPILGPTGIWIATPISWGCGCIVPVVRYYSGKWKLKKLV